MLKDRLSQENEQVQNKALIKINKQLDTTNADEKVILNLLNYMGIEENYNKQIIDNMIKEKSVNEKSFKRLAKLGIYS